MIFFALLEFHKYTTQVWTGFLALPDLTLISFCKLYHLVKLQFMVWGSGAPGAPGAPGLRGSGAPWLPGLPGLPGLPDD